MEVAKRWILMVMMMMGSKMLCRFGNKDIDVEGERWKVRSVYPLCGEKMTNALLGRNNL